MSFTPTFQSIFLGTGPSRSQAHGRPWFCLPIPPKSSTCVLAVFFTTGLLHRTTTTTVSFFAIVDSTYDRYYD